MIDTVRNIMADVVSGKIKDAKILALTSEITDLTVKLTEAELKINDLVAELVIHKPPERVEAETENVLKHVYSKSTDFTRTQIRSLLKLPEDRCNHSLNILLTRGLIAVVGHAMSHNRTEILHITDSGMRYAQTHLT